MSKDEKEALATKTKEKRAYKFTVPERVSALEARVSSLEGIIKTYGKIILICALFGAPAGVKLLSLLDKIGGTP